MVQQNLILWVVGVSFLKQYCVVQKRVHALNFYLTFFVFFMSIRNFTFFFEIFYENMNKIF